MRRTSDKDAQVPPGLEERVLGTCVGETPGPLVVIVGGMHGNEPAGVHAIRRVFEVLRREQPPVRGRLVGLAGNIEALQAGTRYVDRDLNRLWTDEHLTRARQEPSEELEAEEREQRELIRLLEAELEAAPGEDVVLLDLHSTSAEGAPFSIMADTLQNRSIGFALPVPVILGLEERVVGTLLSFFSEKGHVAVCVEGGQHESSFTVEHHVAAIWITLVEAGVLDSADVPWLEEQRERLATTARVLPPVIEVRYRFHVPPGERFDMFPGFSNFDLVERGQPLARFGEGGNGASWPGEAGGNEVRSPADGMILMPRYQGQGEDGFFVGNEVRRFWLRISAFLRRTRMQWVLPMLPGVRRDPAKRGVLRANPRIARLGLIQLFHLFGFRWSRNEGEELLFVRRADRW